MSAFDDAEYVDPEPFIRAGRRAPPVLDGASKKIRDARWEAQRRVHRPAVLLILFAIFGVLAGLFVLLVSRDSREGAMWAVIGIGMIVWFFIVAYGAFEMDRLGSFYIAKAACFMAMLPIPVPTYPLLLGTSIFALVRLNDPKVQRQFRTFRE